MPAHEFAHLKHFRVLIVYNEILKLQFNSVGEENVDQYH